MDINTILLIAVIILIVVLIIVVIVFRGSRVHSQIESMRSALDNRLDTNYKTMNENVHRQMEQSEKLISNITRELTEVKQTGQQVLSFTEQLQALENVLKNPQRRGVLGERILEQVISNVLPPGGFQTQYTFKKSKVCADLVIFLQDEKVICIDSKFSLDTYVKIINSKDPQPDLEKTLRNDIKERIKETSKYILPEEGTLDYAFMFIPSEVLYYDLLSHKVGGKDGESMIEYAFNNYKVIIVSPTTLFAYLQTVSFGLKSLKIEENAKDIINNSRKLQKHLNSYEKNFTSVGKNLETSVNQYNLAQKEFDKIDKDFLKITGESKDDTQATIEQEDNSEE